MATSLADGVASGDPPAGRRTLTVVVAAEPIVGNGVKQSLEALGHSPIVYAETVERAGRFCQGEKPGLPQDFTSVVLWITDDFDPPCYAEASRLRKTCAATALCVLTHRVSAAVLEDLLREHTAGTGLLLRGQHPAIGHVSRTIQQLAEGGSVVDPRVLKRLLSSDHDPLANRLTPMESRIFELLALGFRNREIARRTHRSEKAIEKHISRLFTKLGLAADNDQIDRRVTAARFYYHRNGDPSLLSPYERDADQAHLGLVERALVGEGAGP